MADERVNKIIEERKLPAVQVESIAEGDEEQTPANDDEVPDQTAE